MLSDCIVFLDESGDHSLTSIDPSYPVFVLSLCIFTKDCYANRLTPAVRELKFETFGHDMVVLHEADIVRNKGAFASFGPVERAAFMGKLSALIEACDFTLIAVVIDKAKHKAKYNSPIHPYHWGLQRAGSFLLGPGRGRPVALRRDSQPLEQPTVPLSLGGAGGQKLVAIEDRIGAGRERAWATSRRDVAGAVSRPIRPALPTESVSR